MSSLRETSPHSASARAPARRASSAVASTLVTASPSTRSAPARPNASAIARPIPPPAPVMTTDFPLTIDQTKDADTEPRRVYVARTMSPALGRSSRETEPLITMSPARSPMPGAPNGSRPRQRLAGLPITSPRCSSPRSPAQLVPTLRERDRDGHRVSMVPSTMALAKTPSPRGRRRTACRSSGSRPARGPHRAFHACSARGGVTPGPARSVRMMKATSASTTSAPNRDIGTAAPLESTPLPAGSRTPARRAVVLEPRLVKRPSSRSAAHPRRAALAQASCTV